jgi:hypothetical protein
VVSAAIMVGRMAEIMRKGHRKRRQSSISRDLSLPIPGYSYNCAHSPAFF